MEANQPLRIQDQALHQLLQQRGLTQVGDILGANTLDLIELLGISLKKCQALQDLAARQIAPPPLTAAQLYQTSQSPELSPVPTGLPTLDTALKRGLPVGAISELVGPSGAGKTQMCMSVVLQVVAPKPWGLQKSVIYVDTESKFSATRLADMVQARCSMAAGGAQGDGAEYGHQHHRHHALPPGMTAQQVLSSSLERVKLMHPTEPDQLLHCLHSLPASVRDVGAGLVVVDSIAAFTRTAFDTTGNNSKEAFRSRGELLGQVASQLKSLAEQCGIPVLVTNQVSARFGSATSTHDFQPAAGGGGGGGGSGDGGHLAAALGTAWAHSVNIRIILERYGNQRVLQLIKSPASGNMALEYAILPTGVQEVQALQHAPVQGNVLAAAIQNHIDYRVQDQYEDHQYGM